MSIRNYNFHIGNIVTFAPGKSQHLAIYSIDYSYEIVSIANKTVYMIRLDDPEICDSLKLHYGLSDKHVIRPIEILQHAWKVHSKQEIIATKILFGDKNEEI